MHALLATLETETHRVEGVTTVVVVDDDPDYLWLVRFILESGPDKTAIVGEAASGEEALGLVLHKHPDIVIVDLMMPRLNGLELTRRIKGTAAGEDPPDERLLRGYVSAHRLREWRRRVRKQEPASNRSSPCDPRDHGSAAVNLA